MRSGYGVRRRGKHTGTNGSRPEYGLDHGHDGGQAPLLLGEFGLDGVGLAAGLLELQVGLGGLELDDLALELLGPEALAFADSALGLAVWVGVSGVFLSW